MMSLVMKSFKEKVLKVVGNIPRGKTLTYKQVAKRAGSPLAFRAVGNIMAKNFNMKVPCHRVIKSDGTFGNYNRGGTKNKIKLLRKEGAIK
jgi:O-6-methylguanine DNA methyltransferase